MADWNLPITLADIIVLLVLVLSALLAFARGFVHEVLAIAGWIGAIFATVYGLPYVRPYGRMIFENTAVADIAAGLALFLVSLIILSLITRALSQRIRNSQLNALDRSLGFVFGLARGIVLIALLYMAVDWLMPASSQPAWIREARSMPLVEGAADLLRSVVPNGQAETGTASAQDAAHSARKALETHQMLRDMMNPEPRRDAESGKTAGTGYSAEERREFERLLDSSEGRN
jgi:membrane protein required for colicin V production